MSLNDTLIRSARPKAKPYKLPRERGLFLLVNPNGAKLWRLSYTFAGREKLLSLGAYPDVPLRGHTDIETGQFIKGARDLRDDARKLLAAGIDPSAQRQAENARQHEAALNTFKAVATQWLAMRVGVLSPGTLNKARWMLETVYPYIGDMPLADMQPPHILQALRQIENSGRLETMHRVKARISEVFRFAIATGRATSDPTRDLRGALKPKPATKHHAALTDPKAFGQLLRAIDGYTGTPEVCTALKLAPLLFVRPGELRAAQWPQFDLDSDTPAWRYFVTKTRADHIVPLSAQAVFLLRELRPLTDVASPRKPDAPRYVFPSARTRERPMSENTVTAALRALGYSGEQMTGHGFRATARTLLAERGWNPDAIERQLAHKASGPLGAAYDRAQFLQDRRRMMQSWADYLDGLKRGTVVTLARAA
ncbi:MAG: integrase arm-type DNA-binding domain-containing protein [Sinimarinibacterium sp.]|jgi:integrase